jgi:hypothetical protein
MNATIMKKIMQHLAARHRSSKTYLKSNLIKINVKKHLEALVNSMLI